jgi:hypothetical protein
LQGAYNPYTTVVMPGLVRLVPGIRALNRSRVKDDALGFDYAWVDLGPYGENRAAHSVCSLSPKGRGLG